MTAVRTKFEAGCFAVTASSQKIIILNRFKQITIAKVDNFTPLYQEMRIDPDKIVPIELLINACIVYRMATDLGLSPGLFVAGDKAILDHCLANISDDVVPEDKELLIHELKSSWQQISTHPMLKKYIRLGEYMSVDDEVNCLLAPMGGFELFILDYFTGCMKAYVKQSVENLELFKQWVYLVFSTLHGDGFIPNRFLKMELFLKKCTQILAEAGQEQAKIQTLLKATKEEHESLKSTWFTDVTGWAKIELDEIEDEERAGHFLTDLLEHSEPVHRQLSDLAKEFNAPNDQPNPLMRAYRGANTSASEINEMMKEAIVYAIYTYAKTHNINLYPTLLGNLPVYRLAGMGESQEAELIAYLLREENSRALQAFELYIILRKAKNEALRDIAQQTISGRAREQEFFSMIKRFGTLAVIPAPFCIGSAFMPRLEMTPQFSRLERAAKGAAPKKDLLIDEQPPVDQDAAENAVQDTLNLQKPGQCVII